MQRIDKEAFAGFLTQLRREKEWTQKELAEKLFVSDKAVSKWERGLSLPDISLLIPMAELLEVTVTELLEGRRISREQELGAQQVEELVKRAITISEADPEAEKKRLKKHVWIFLAAGAVVALEKLVLHLAGAVEVFASYQIFEVLTVCFGVYFWFFMKERLPDYYDQNRITAFSDGPFRMNLPGISFNNTNWPHIVRTLRVWSLTTMLTLPLLSLGLSLLPEGLGTGLPVQMGVLLVYLAGLMVPVCLVGRKYEGREPMDRKRWVTLAAVGLLMAALFFGNWSFGSAWRSGVRMGYMESGGLQSYSASYRYLDGTQQKILHPRQTVYQIQVETLEGILSLELRDETGVLFSQENIQTGSYSVTLTEKTYITVRAEGHRGSFSISPAS